MNGLRPFPLSAATPDALRDEVTAHVQHLAAQADGDFDALVRTACLGREHLAERVVAIGRDAAEVAHALESWLEGGAAACVAGVAAPLAPCVRFAPLIGPSPAVASVERLAMGIPVFAQALGTASPAELGAVGAAMAETLRACGVAPGDDDGDDGAAIAIGLTEPASANGTLGCWSDPDDPCRGFLLTLAQLHVRGVAVDWSGVVPAGSFGRLPVGSARLHARAHARETPVETTDAVETTDGETPVSLAALRALVAEVLEADLDDVPDDVPLCELGLDSLMTRELRARVERRLGRRVDRLEGIGGANIVELARLLVSALETDGAPAAVGDDVARFGLTDIQQAYVVGRRVGQPLGGVMCHLYVELEADTYDAPRLERALDWLVARHPMLRAVVRDDGTQEVRDAYPEPVVPVIDLADLGDEEARRRLAEERAHVSHRVGDPSADPPVHLRVVRRSEDCSILQLSVDLVAADAESMRLVVEELAQRLADPGWDPPPPTLTFAQLVEAVDAATDEDWRWWDARLDALPGSPQLPYAAQPETVRVPRFRRLSATLSAELWAALRAKASTNGLTPTAAICAAFAETLGRWSADQHFCLNVTTERRPLDLPGAAEVVGDFTSFTLLEVDRALGATFAARADALQRQLWADLEHPVSGVRLLRELGRRRGQRTLMPVVFTSLIGRPSLGDALARLGRVGYAISQTPQVVLDHQVIEHGGALVLTWDVVEEALPAEVADAMFAAYTRAVEALASHAAAWEATPVELPLEQCERRRNVNDTAGAEGKGLLHDAVERWCAQAPDRPAVIVGDRTVTFGELDRRASAVAHVLREAGVQPDELVAVAMEKGWEQVVAVLGILRAGAAYLPIDGALPETRIRHLIERGGCRVALCQPGRISELLARERVRTVEVTEALASKPWREPCPARRDQLAYVIFTSGSTGEPKGVMIEHGAALNTVEDLCERLVLDQDDRVLGLSSLSFDLSVFDIFGVLGRGGALVLPDAASARTPTAWVKLVERERVTLWNSVPALFTLLVDALEEREACALPLRVALLSGDWIPVTLPDRARRLMPACDLLSLGGATEASIWSVAYPIGEVDPEWDSIPYGVPLRNQRFDVVNALGEDCPDYVAGELLIGGRGVARGYWRDPERTAASFEPHPCTGAPRYRTGDIGRYRPDGTIEFLGRRDGQVKVNGYRVEVGEVEAALLRHPGVRAAAVAALGEREERRLVAYVVPELGERPQPRELRAFLGEALPGYMVPGAIVALDALPLTANGKVDRSALPDPAEERAGHADSADAPDADLAAWVEQLARTTLKLPEGVGLDDDLIDLGVDSLDLMSLGSKLEQRLGLGPEVSELEMLMTLRAIVEWTLDKSAAAPPPAARPAMLFDADERAAAKRERRDLRRDLDGDRLPLPVVRSDRGLLARRRSQRTFSGAPVARHQLSWLLGQLGEWREGETVRRAYASAGGTYAVQTYVQMRDDAVADGLRGGMWWLDPTTCEMVDVRAAQMPDRTAHAPENRELVDSAAFLLYLVREREAIDPLYGDLGRDFCLLEAGMIAHLLQTIAPEAGLGLCSLGYVDARVVGASLRLGDTRELLHALAGGPLP